LHHLTAEAEALRSASLSTESVDAPRLQGATTANT
jgi:hypothetical protein